MWRRAVLVVVLLLSALSCSFAQQEQTLAGVLEQKGIPLPTAIPAVNSRITSYATLDVDQEFMIAYYLVDLQDPNVLRPPLLIARFNKKDNEWSQVSQSGVKVRALGEENGPGSDCLGSASRIERHNGRYYLNLHLTPSAGCTLILNHDLTVNYTFPGWTEAFFNSGMVVYTGNMVHFAPTHPEKLFVYDPVKQQSQQLYPPKDDPFRERFVARLAKVMADKKRCGQDNWACDPEEFESYTPDRILVNDETHSLAFQMDFSPVGFLSEEEAEDSGQWDDDQYVYIYQLNPLRWREFSVYDLKPKFGTDTLQDPLTPGKLKQVFATPAP